MKKYFLNTAWMMIDSLFGKVLGLIVVAIVARFLGPEHYGMYAYVGSMAALFTVLGHMGLDGLLVRELVRQPSNQPEILGTALGLKMIGYGLGAVGLVLFGLLNPDHQPEERWLFVIAAPAVICMPLTAVLRNWFSARVEARYGAMASAGANFSASVFKTVAVLTGAGVIAIGLGSTAGAVIGLLLTLMLYWRRGGPRPYSWRFSRPRARGMLTEGWMIFAGSLFAVIYLKIDIVMLRILRDSETVGIYSVAALVSESTYFIPAAIVTTVFPRLVQISGADPDALLPSLQKLFYVLSFAGISLLVLVSVSGPVIISYGMGPSYGGSISLLLIHLLALPFIFLRQGFSRWILITKMAKFSMISQGAGAALNVALNWVLIPNFGGSGAAVATVASYASASYLVLFFSDATRPIFRLMTRALFQPWRGATLSLGALRKYRD